MKINKTMRHPSAATTAKKKPDRALRSTKAAIQSLAHQLWIEKRRIIPSEQLDWLVDRRLMDQLDGLSKSQLLRVKRLLARTVVAPDTRHMTASAV